VGGRKVARKTVIAAVEKPNVVTAKPPLTKDGLGRAEVQPIFRAMGCMRPKPDRGSGVCVAP
jgi:hypothetical protein